MKHLGSISSTSSHYTYNKKMTSDKGHQRTSLARQRTLTKGHSTSHNTKVKSVVVPASNISKVGSLDSHCMKLYPDVPTFSLRDYHRRLSRKPGTSFYPCQVIMNTDPHPYKVSEGQIGRQISYLAVVKSPCLNVCRCQSESWTSSLTWRQANQNTVLIKLGGRKWEIRRSHQEINV